MYYKWQSNDVWFLKYWAWQTDFLSFWTNFCPFAPPNNPKYQNFEKLKKTPGDIIILRMCTINDNHMMYGSWDIKQQQTEFFVILDNFLPTYPVKTQKIKIAKKWKKHPEISFYTSEPKIMIICYTVPGIWCVTDVIVRWGTHLCAFFHPSICRAPFLRNCTSSNHNFWYTCVKWW